MLLARRSVLGLGASLAVLPAGRLLAETRGGFTHGVASGEPQADSILLWTRFVGEAGAVALMAEVAESADFRRVIAGGRAIADASADWTARTTVTGLASGRRYFYRFVAPDGTRSPVGRTATLPAGSPDRYNIAVFSCANLPFGWFNAYGHAAGDDTLDLVIHLGDYIYEYPRGTYPPEKDIVAGRVIEPTGWVNTLASYRLRYGSYRRDPDLQALHARQPWLAIWDDHEFADNAWTNGSYDQDDKRDGPWAVRKAAAEQAWLEWLPVSHPAPDATDVGSLATLIRLENRVTGRRLPADMYGVKKGAGDLAANLRAFRRDEWLSDRNRMISPTQEAWLARTLAQSARRTRFQILVNSVPMGYCFLPHAAMDWRPTGGQAGLDDVAFLVAASDAGVPFNQDNWNGFPAQRGRVLAAASAAKARLIVLSGDSHNHWAYRLQHRGREVGIELGVGSISSPGFERWFPDADPRVVAGAMVARNPEMRWADTSNRGYGRLELTPTNARLHWLASADVRTRTPAARIIHTEDA